MPTRDIFALPDGIKVQVTWSNEPTTEDVLKDTWDGKGKELVYGWYKQGIEAFVDSHLKKLAGTHEAPTEEEVCAMFSKGAKNAIGQVQENDCRLTLEPVYPMLKSVWLQREKCDIGGTRFIFSSKLVMDP
jgi:hypothetical protein